MVQFKYGSGWTDEWLLNVLATAEGAVQLLLEKITIIVEIVE